MVTENIAAQLEEGFGAEEGTRAIQAAINDETVDTIVLENKGTPWLISEQINLQSNKTIIFEPGVVVRAEGDNFLAENVSLFEARNVDNVNLIGQVEEGEARPVLQMNKEAYDELDRQPILDENGQPVLDENGQFVFDDSDNPEKFEAQFNHVVELLGVDGYKISGLEITGGGGDGIHIAGGTFNTPPEPGSGILPYSQDGIIEDVVSDNNRRQGLSIDSANGLIVRDSTFSNTGGAPGSPEPPEAGIDLEPTWDFESLQNITIEDVTIDNNDGHGILFALGNLDDDSADISVDIKNVDITNIDSDKAAIFVAGRYFFQQETDGLSSAEIQELENTSDALFKGKPDRSSPESTINGTIDIEGVNISNAEAIANSTNPDDNPNLYIFIEDISGSQDDPNNLQVNFKDIDISDPTDKSVNTTPIYIAGLGGDYKPSEIGNLFFDNVNIRGNYNRSVVAAELGNDDAVLNNISGDITVFNSGDGSISNIDRTPTPENFTLTVIDGNAGSTDPITGAVEIINPGFQDGLNGWNGRSEDISVVERSGDDSWVRLDSSLTGGITQDITGKITSGENYRISATAQVEDLGTYAAIGINYKNEAGELQEFQNIDITSDTPQNFELGLTVPQDFATAEIFAYKQEGSAVFVDDFVLTQV